MGNREALLIGAKRCLLEQGYAQTTARDIAKEAGVSLAAIGYHFSSKEALMMEALLLAFDDWDRDFRRLLETGVPPNASPVERFESTWARLIDTFETHRSLWATNMEVFSQVSRMPELRQTLGGSLATARSELASLFLGKERNTVSEQTAQSIGKFHHVLLTGLIAQWLLDREHALSARELTKALLAIAATLQTAPAAHKAKAKRTKRTTKPKRTGKSTRPRNGR